MRASVFWFLDALRGAPLRREWLRVRHEAGMGGLPADARRARLAGLLDHACRTTRYYKAHRPDRGLSAFPVITKRAIREQPDAFLSDAFERARLRKVTTSGSSGEPFACYHDPCKVRRKLADLLLYNGEAGYRVGLPHLLIRATPKSRLTQWMQNEIWIDPTRWDRALLERVSQHLHRRRMVVAIGYPSIMADVATYARNRLADPSALGLRVFIATSELFTPQQRDVIRDTFGCRCVSRYATEEFGVLGQSDDACTRFRLNTSSHIVEILARDRDVPVAPGDVGRVVVTDLFARGMPLIRYDTGDLARLDRVSEDAMGAIELSSIEGKVTAEICDTAGHRVAPLSVLVAMKGFHEVQQFQLAQCSRRRYVMRVSPRAASAPPALRETLLSILGADADLLFEYVDSIPALPSGKRPTIVNES